MSPQSEQRLGQYRGIGRSRVPFPPAISTACILDSVLFGVELLGMAADEINGHPQPAFK